MGVSVNSLQCGETAWRPPVLRRLRRLRSVGRVPPPGILRRFTPPGTAATAAPAATAAFRRRPRNAAFRRQMICTTPPTASRPSELRRLRLAE